ncbi:hypothetical protein IFM89_007714 [Coptis chinensis]|uniref:FHA domain-containing protein n=1 Tax=Coptis chinensis TaxID=261450 RepID=A0A835ITV6_9MAGN|nr:hypothetical protein IFM89_007714 [Coptis chinensis]
MVWGLFPVDSLPGCDVIVNTDKGVSRVHAEVVIDSMTWLDPLQRRSTSFSTNVRIKDCSKYGTFLNKKSGSKTKVGEYPNKEAPVKDEDLISFGTGNATYRFCFVPIVFFVYGSKANCMECSLQEDVSSIGAGITHSWKEECTHMLVDESMPVKEDLLDAIVAQKPVVLKSWLKVIAEKKIRTEIPGCDIYVPTLTLEGLPVKIVDPKLRESCVAGYTFVLGSLELVELLHSSVS